MANSNYYLGRSPEDTLGDSPRYWYALRRNEDGELFIVRSDQVIDKDAYQLNIPGPLEENFEDFEPGVDFFDGVDVDHEPVYENMYYPQYRWDNRSIFYYVDAEGLLIQRINQGYSYPTGIST